MDSQIWKNNLALPLLTIPACPLYLNSSLSTLQSITSPFPYLTLHCTIVLYHTFLQDKLSSCSAPVQTLDQCWLALSSCCPSKYTYSLFPMFCGSFPILSMSLLISSSLALILLLHIPLQAAVFHHHTPICKNLKTFEANTIGHVVMQRPCAMQNSKIMMDQHIPLTHSAPKNYSLCSRIHWFRITQKK